jgi:hypothetical protein
VRRGESIIESVIGSLDVVVFGNALVARGVDVGVQQHSLRDRPAGRPAVALFLPWAGCFSKVGRVKGVQRLLRARRQSAVGGDDAVAATACQHSCAAAASLVNHTPRKAHDIYSNWIRNAAYLFAHTQSLEQDRPDRIAAAKPVQKVFCLPSLPFSLSSSHINLMGFV